MSLRRQLVLVALISLILPWAAWQYLVELEQVLRRGEERALLATAAAVARGVESNPPAVLNRSPGHYLRPGARVVVDGYDDDWQPWLAWMQPLTTTDAATLRARAALAADQEAVYLLLLVEDRQVVYGSPGGERRGDHLWLALDGRDFLLTNLAPGWVAARPADGAAAAAVRGEWQDLPGGYGIELRIPRSLLRNSLGLRVVDVDAAGAGPVGEARLPPAPLLEPAAGTAERLSELVPQDMRVWLVSAQGWVLGRAGQPYPRADQPQGRWWRSLVYRYLIRPPLDPAQPREGEVLRLAGDEVRAALAGVPGRRWQPAGEESTVLGAAAQPVRLDGRVVGAVVVEQASDALLLFTNQALGRLLGLTGLVLLTVVAGLLGFATWLSLRIRRLRDAAEAAVGADGRVRPFAPSTRRDELGDLSRSVARTLASLRDYTDYLRGLASRLSHELRTPLAVVSSSLDNLQQQALPPGAEPYTRRAREGAERLSRILRAMSEANRIEQSLQHEEPEPFQLDRLLQTCAEAYRDLSPGHELTVEIEPGDYRLHGMPELIVQMLDKLVDNAFGFTPPGGRIRLRLAPGAQGVELAVANQGPPLPQRMQDRLFDSLVSLREGDERGPHLGLGLYIVRLVAELHHGGVSARDLPGGQGVEFLVRLHSVAGQV